MSPKATDFHHVARQAEGLAAVLDTKPIEQEVSVGIASTSTLAVTDAVTYAAAGEHLVGLATLKKRIEEYFEADVKNAHTLWSSLTGKRKKAVDAVEGRIAQIKRMMAGWSQEQERIRREEELRASREAKRFEDERIAAEAALLETHGQPELAAAVLEQAIAAPAPMVSLPSNVPKVAGVSTVEAWDFDVINEDLLPRKYMSKDMKKIRADVDALKGMTKIPGVRVFRNDHVRVRAS
jgi:hypothetical protein